VKVRIFAFLSLLLIFSVTAFAAAQEVPPPPEGDTSGLDPVTTPSPLPTMGARPAPVNAVRTETGETVLQFYFPNIAQGQIGVMRIYGTNPGGSPIQSVSATFLNESLEFYPAQVEEIEDSFYGIISANMEQPTRNNAELITRVTYEDGSTAALNTPIQIVLGGFIRQNVTLPPDTAFLLDIETERNELARLESIFQTYTLSRYWDDTGFQVPINNNFTSPFGAFRTFNDSLNTRHTGWDIQTTLGVPVMASAAGRVAYAGGLEIRGNHIIIDHGYGVFSGYSHLSQIHVTRGESIAKGQIIGLTGATGRTSGPHFHWEMAVNGNWVDSQEFIRAWKP
jgi:murein DD-endopeptidase MepM/ murein hydrolase activator NlpD